jgi:hypothetical protein
MPEEVSLRSFIERLLALSAIKDASTRCHQTKFFAKPVQGYACASLTQRSRPGKVKSSFF